MVTLLTISDFAAYTNPQDEFEKYIKDLEIGDITIKQPEGYESIDMRPESRREYFWLTSFPLGESIALNSLHPIGLMSPDKHAVLLFPYVSLNSGVASLRITSNSGTQIEKEIRSVNRNLDLDVKSLVNVIAQKDMNDYANADTIAIYMLDLTPIGINFMNRYNKCIGVYLRKYGHAALMLKIMLDETGFSNNDKYIKVLLDNVRYGDSETLLTKWESQIKGSNFNFKTKGEWPSDRSAEEYLIYSRNFYDRLKAKWEMELE